MSFRRIVASLTLAVVTASVVPMLSAPIASADAGPRLVEPVGYTVELRSSARGRDWTGSASITIRNNRAEPLDQVWFRLWANSTTGCSDPAITVDVTRGTAGPLDVACTALPVTLETPLEPGLTDEVAMRIDIHLPKRDDRLGYSDGTARLGAALPILAVFDDEEGWHLDPPFDGGESYYSEVSDWSVTLDVPAGLETPATGTLEDVTTQDGREQRRYVALDVRDFAWEAGSFARVRVRDERGVRVNLWYPARATDGGSPSPGRTISRDRARKLARGSAHDLDVFSDAFGAYPYPELDVVITSFDSFGGMEYPQLVMSIPDPLVISHEIAHQWWYAIVGNDEFEDPWIDEGFAQWSMFLPFDRLRRNWPPVPFVGCSMFEWPNDEIRLSSGIDYFRIHPGDYWVPYWQGACALAHLAQDLGGLQPFLDVLKAYAAQHWLGVATNDDVIAMIRDAIADLGADVDADTFLERWRITRP